MGNRYFIPDIETGFKVEVSKEQWERYVKMWEAFKPTITESPIKAIVVFGTGGNMEEGNNFMEMFFNPNGYNDNGK